MRAVANLLSPKAVKISMLKYFIASDIHSFYTPFIQALKKSGFQKTNPDHILVICGDLFDRGDETMEVYNFIRSIPKKRRVLIRGNHEALFCDLLDADFPGSHDFHNGTVNTFCQIAGYDIEKLDFVYWRSQAINEGHEPSFYHEKPYEYWAIIKKIVKESSIAKWILSKEWKNYYEFGDYICVHSFIPVKVKEEYRKFLYWVPAETLSEKCFEYDPDWRETEDWYDAVWGCPWAKYKEGLFAPENKDGKTLICGHWHAYDFRIHLDGVSYKTKEDVDFTTYISKDIIALDGCTVASGICNVLTITL